MRNPKNPSLKVFCTCMENQYYTYFRYFMNFGFHFTFLKSWKWEKYVKRYSHKTHIHTPNTPYILLKGNFPMIFVKIANQTCLVVVWWWHKTREEKKVFVYLSDGIEYRKENANYHQFKYVYKVHCTDIRSSKNMAIYSRHIIIRQPGKRKGIQHKNEREECCTASFGEKLFYFFVFDCY